MRNRTYGGVRGRRGQLRPLLDPAFEQSHRLHLELQGVFAPNLYAFDIYQLAISNL